MKGVKKSGSKISVKTREENDTMSDAPVAEHCPEKMRDIFGGVQ
jgi:hypothetical protein